MTEERLSRLRHEMNAEGIDAIIFPTGDPHGSEYVAPYWQARQWITGFTGSAGTAVVTQDEAALWTDSRYFLQAAQQLQGTGFTLMKDGLADTPSITEWLMRKMSAINGRCVAIDGMVTTYAEITAIRKDLARSASRYAPTMMPCACCGMTVLPSPQARYTASTRNI